MDATLPKPDTLSLAGSAQEEWTADRVRVDVTVRGLSTFSGQAALRRAEEVRALVGGLVQVGIQETAFTLRDVRVATVGGLLGKSSAAIYEVRFACEDLALLAEVLGVVATQKNATLRNLDWDYRDREPRQRALAGRALAQVQAQARATAAALGVELLGVYAYREQFLVEGEAEAKFRSAQFYREPGTGMARQRAEPPDLGFSLNHTVAVTARVDVEYRISPFRTGAPAAPTEVGAPSGS